MQKRKIYEKSLSDYPDLLTMWFRNIAIQRGIDTIDIDRLLVKLYKARKA